MCVNAHLALTGVKCARIQTCKDAFAEKNHKSICEQFILTNMTNNTRGGGGHSNYEKKTQKERKT